MTSSTATPMTSLDLMDRPLLNTSFRRPAMLALTCDMHELLDVLGAKTLERVKGIEPSYSAWKAAALPLSYTRAQAMNYHAMDVASTAMRRFGPVPEASIARRQP